MTIDNIRTRIEAQKTRSAWKRGVKLYAFELLDDLEQAIADEYFTADDMAAPKLVKRALLNGASSWSEYSYGGCALIYDSDIAKRLCCPSELKKARNGGRRPNSQEEWLDVQARALSQAANMICSAAHEIASAEEVPA